MAEEPEFRPLFEDGRREGLSDELGLWYAEKYVIDKPSEALGILRGMEDGCPFDFGTRWHTNCGRERLRQRLRARWLPHLLANAPARYW